jgi:hypothetical protein
MAFGSATAAGNMPGSVERAPYRWEDRMDVVEWAEPTPPHPSISFDRDG